MQDREFRKTGAWEEFSQGKHQCLNLKDRHRVIMLKKLIKYIESNAIQPT